MYSHRALSRSQTRNRVSANQSNTDSSVISNLTIKKLSNQNSLPQLFSNEKLGTSSLLANNSSLHIAVCSQQGRRPYQEDQYSIRTFLSPTKINDLIHDQKDSLKTHFFGLFDGHAGGRCSRELANSFPSFLADDPEYFNDLPKALIRTFNVANTHFLKTAEKLKLHDGSTGLCAIVRDKKLLVANVGDCRALLISADFPVPMSFDQKPNNPEEIKRIISFGGSVEMCNGNCVLNKISLHN